ncbi:MAG: undecaprenyldiphospho-muramoylpentapeptide beta-N-acetylglucosaminyltransferase [Azoarcus sp.]|jgi:UDP-N-acetylglucosamine--N-acetylmuramyl-(pentapeptide) pyrophosphoryl-undecaprenol N-acetylglucosamine transferase|nr:undecaprenyldiphospho-muramoylpentapeptide beta-N-acetylglucosaminyltransferase [Azoarcus sp.]
MKTALIMAGGTGGHIFPGIAIAEYLRERGWEAVWLGNPNGMEARLVPARGYRTEWLRFGALRGKGVARKLLLPFNLASGCWKALGILSRVRPDVVVGLGGYITFPAGMMAALSRRPLILHEQNSIAGLANKVLARMAARVFTGFPDALPRAQWVGNPVRAEIVALPPPAERFAGRAGRLKLLVVGGSLGAAALNDTVPRALARIPGERRPEVVHQAGEKQIDALRAAYAEAGVEGDLRPFIDDMAGAYGEADIVLCRAGALTVAELTAAGAASVLVPFPYAVDDHQTANAHFLSSREAAWLVPQPELNPEKLAAMLDGLERGRLLRMAENARALAKPSAAAEVAKACEELAGKEKA